jgi:hypothetical protein
MTQLNGAAEGWPDFMFAQASRARLLFCRPGILFPELYGDLERGRANGV